MLLASSAFELFDCAKNEDGNYYLNSEPSVRCGWQGLTLVHFSAQLEPCLTQGNTLDTLNTP